MEDETEARVDGSAVLDVPVFYAETERFHVYETEVVGLEAPEDVERRGEGEGDHPNPEHCEEGAHRLKAWSRWVHDQLLAKRKIV